MAPRDSWQGPLANEGVNGPSHLNAVLSSPPSAGGLESPDLKLSDLGLALSFPSRSDPTYSLLREPYVSSELDAIGLKVPPALHALGGSQSYGVVSVSLVCFALEWLRSRAAASGVATMWR